MQTRAASPVIDIPFGKALKISLDNYYDLLKLKIGGLAAHEFLQLKLIADPVALSDDDASAGGYRWWSYWNLLQRSDLGISPSAIADEVATSAVKLTAVYGDFLDVLLEYVALKNLTHQQQLESAKLTLEIQSLKDDNEKLVIDDQLRWKRHADLFGYPYGDKGHYLAWASTNGNQKDIATNDALIKSKFLAKKKIFNTQFADPIDKKIVDALNAFDSTLSMLGYPIHPDYLYSDGSQFSPNYLSTMVGSGSGNALFDARRVLSWQLPLKKIMSTGAGQFDAMFDKTTVESTSIITDWSGSGGGSYAFIRASASSSSHTQIKSDFTTGTSIKLHAEAAFRLNLLYPSWFDASLFACKYVRDNPADFELFFGEKGTLLYYPTSLILVRGFSVSFEASQNWSYDYKRTFSASAGGGFSAFGISFGGSGGYSENTEEHKVDQSKTSLTFSDDKDTLRFVGYAVAKNTVFHADRNAAIEDILGKDVYASLTK